MGATQMPKNTGNGYNRPSIFLEHTGKKSADGVEMGHEVNPEVPALTLGGEKD
jgi:hypothetical protein